MGFDFRHVMIELENVRAECQSQVDLDTTELRIGRITLYFFLKRFKKSSKIGIMKEFRVGGETLEGIPEYSHCFF